MEQEWSGVGGSNEKARKENMRMDEMVWKHLDLVYWRDKGIFVIFVVQVEKREEEEQ